MSEQLFDPDEGRRQRDSAMDRVDTNAADDWKRQADDAIFSAATYASRRPERAFTTDLVWYMLKQHEAITPHEPRALGPRMDAAAARGWIERTEETRNSSRPECHSRPVRLWRSKL